jgi:hypothetical protein
VVPVHGVHEADGLPYLVMQYIAGESLQSRLDRTGPLEVREIVRIGLQTALGLAAAHAQGLIHRDIKPANLLLENGLARIKITDFGLARMIDDVGLTQSGVVAGTPEYMAPEQARGETIDHRADQFSLGSVLYALCTGVPPFRGSTTLAVLRQVSEQTPLPIRSLNPDVPEWLEQMIARLMAKGPTGRFESMSQVAELLEAFLAHLQNPVPVPLPQLPPPADASRKPLQPGRLARGTRWLRRSLWLAVVALLGLFLFQGPVPQKAPPPDAEQRAEFHHDFRGSRPPAACFQRIGANPDIVFKPEEAGLRITIPANQRQNTREGLELTTPIKGDFEIIVGYEVLSAGRPTTGYGVGFEFYIYTNTPTREGLGVYRVRRVKQGDVYMISRSKTENGKGQYKHQFVETSARTGRLRLTRSGTEVRSWAAEGGSSRFVELCQHELGAEDVTTVWLTAYVGHTLHGADVRIVDLKINSDLKPGDQALTLEQAPDLLGKSRRIVLLLAAGFLILVIAFTYLCSVWARTRRGEPVSTDRSPT